MLYKLIFSSFLFFGYLIFFPFIQTGCALETTQDTNQFEQNNTAQKITPVPNTSFSDEQLLDKLQKDIFNYVLDYSFPESGMVYEDSKDKDRNETVDVRAAVGATGFGIAGLIVGVERKWISRPEAVNRILKICIFLHDKTNRTALHGAFPHWVDGRNGKIVPFWENDDSADIVETSFLMQGLLLAREYFSSDNSREKELAALITELWHDVNWHWFSHGENNGLYWHWSPTIDFKKTIKVGFNEALVTYILALGSPTYPISRQSSQYWYSPDQYQSKSYNGYTIEAANKYSDSMFLSHYSFIGLNPALLFDSHVKQGYLVRNITHTLMNRAYCLESAPPAHKFSEGYWGLTSCKIKGGYRYQSAYNEDGTVAPTAAISSMPYTPEYSMHVLRNIYENYPNFIGKHGPFDAFNLKDNWFDNSYLALDQLPMLCLIENYRSGLLWKLFMNIPEVKIGLERMGISQSLPKTGFIYSVPAVKKDEDKYVVDAVDLRPHPDRKTLEIPFSSDKAQPITFELSLEGATLAVFNKQAVQGYNILSFSSDRLPLNKKITLSMSSVLNAPSLPIRVNNAK